MTHNHGWIGVDLDGTLAEYHGWRGIEHIGAPVQAMLERVRSWVAAGQEIKIFTARVSGQPYEASLARLHIQDWLQTHGLPRLEVTNVKDFRMTELWDDRAVRVVFNTGERGE